MKKYRILYWCGLYKTECWIKANNEKEAEQKFRKLKGENAEIIKIGEISL